MSSNSKCSACNANYKPSTPSQYSRYRDYRWRDYIPGSRTGSTPVDFTKLPQAEANSRNECAGCILLRRQVSAQFFLDHERWEYVLSVTGERPQGDRWQVHPAARPPHWPRTHVPYRRLRDRRISAAGPTASPSSPPIKHRKRTSEHPPPPNSFANKRTQPPTGALAATGPAKPAADVVMLSDDDDGDGDNKGANAGAAGAAGQSTRTAARKPFVIDSSEEDEGTNAMVARPGAGTILYRTNDCGDDGGDEETSPEIGTDGVVEASTQSGSSFYFTVSMCLASSDPEQTSVYDVLRERCKAATEQDQSITLDEPLGQSTFWSNNWSIVEDYTTLLDPTDGNDDYRSDDVTVYVPPRERYSGYKFISPVLSMEDMERANNEFSRLLTILKQPGDTRFRDASQKLAVRFTPTSFVHVHLEGFRQGDYEGPAKFCTLYMLYEDIFSRIFTTPSVPENSPLTRSMWGAWERRWWRKHPHHPPKEVAPVGEQLVSHMRSCTSLEEVVATFNSEDMALRMNQPAYGHDYPGTIPKHMRAHVKGLFTINPDLRVDKYYKVNLGYAMYNYGTVEFRGFPPGFMQNKDIFPFTIHFCMWMLYISSEVDWNVLAYLGKLKDLCDRSLKPQGDIMWTALFGIVGDVNRDAQGDGSELERAAVFCEFLYSLAKIQQDLNFSVSGLSPADQEAKKEPMNLMSDSMPQTIRQRIVAGTNWPATKFFDRLCKRVAAAPQRRAPVKVKLKR